LKDMRLKINGLHTGTMAAISTNKLWLSKTYMIWNS
jgi:hypothetical protein